MPDLPPSAPGRRLSGVLMASLIIGLTPCVHAQNPALEGPPIAASQFDPSEAYFQGYLSARTGEQMVAAGDHLKAAEKFRKANELFNAVRRYYPDWKPDMVALRFEKNQKALALAEEMAKKQLDDKRNAIAELEGGIRIPGQVTDPSNLDNTPRILKVDPVASRRLQEAEQEVSRLKAMLAKETLQRQQLEQQNANNSNSAANLKHLQNLSAKEREIAEAEIRQLRKEALLEKARAEAEIKRLSELSGESRKQSEDKIRQLKELADNANNSAETEFQRLQKLHGKEKQQAEAEMQRLRQIAETARKDAEREMQRLSKLAPSPTNTYEAELKRAKDQAMQAQAKAEARQAELESINQRNASVISNLSVERAQLEAQLRAAETNVATLRNRLAKAPVESEVLTLNLRIKQLEQEREAMSMTLRQTQGGYNEATGKVSNLESELQKTRQQISDLNRNLEAERNAANAVVAGQRRQLEAMQKLLDERSAELARANEQIASLNRELEESRDAYEQLREERDSLLIERDQMAALLKLNEDGRIDDLIQQNVAAVKKLREAEEKSKRLFIESNADKDSITEALRDLAIAKSQINRLHQEKREQEQRIAELETRLEAEDKALSDNPDTVVDPAEAEMLRDVLIRTLRAQKCRVQARDLLVKAAKRMGQGDNELQEAVDLLDQQELALTPEEQKLIADRNVDREFISPFARDRNAVDKSTAGLNEEIAIYERTARKSFLAGRLTPTRELYEMILEQHPGHTATLCRLGVVHLKLQDPLSATDSFRRAVELDNHNPYALRMLAYALMKTGKLGEAEQAAQESVKLEPNDDKAHVLLATLCYRLGRLNDAEAHFKGAINANPLPSEPYYNLALIYSSTGKIEKARDYYHQALERGAMPDPSLAKTLSIQ